MARPRLRPMTPDDITQVTASMLADSWGDRRSWFEFAVGHPTCHAVVAEVDDEIVGTGVATLSGRVCWIGTIWVAPPWRRDGLGTGLTQATIDAAAEAGARTLVLVATEAGRPLYEKLGFEIQSWYRTIEAPGTDAEPPAGHRDVTVRPFEAADLASMTACDANATGEDRSTILAAFATPESSRVAIDRDGVVRGFVVRAVWGGGATIAPDPDAAMAILHARRQSAGPGRHVRAGILLENEAGSAMLHERGWTEAWRAPRLIRGEPLEWNPTHIWGQFNHALG